MICAYDKVYLERARTALGRMLDYAVHDMHYDIEKFFGIFISSGIAERFGSGDFTLLAGKSGVEIALEVVEKATGFAEKAAPVYTDGKSPEYWAGWALAYYQWATFLSFSEIVRAVPIKEILSLYSPYHEMDIRQFCDKMNELYKAAVPDTNLKTIRSRAGLTQKELSEQSGVPLRTIQQYEQRQKDINKAGIGYLVTLSRALCCKTDELIEKVTEREN